MKITIKAEPEEIAKLLRAIASSEEKTNGKLTSSIFMGPDKPEKMCSSDLYLNF